MRSNHSGLTTRAEAKNGTAWDFIVRECNGLPTKLRGLIPPKARAYHCTPELMDRQLLAVRNLIPDDVVTDPRQFVAQSLGGHAGIGLGSLAIVVSPEAFIISAAQVSRLHKCPA